VTEAERDVVVIGEALVDVVSRYGRASAMPGGSPLNVAVGLGRLRRATSLVALIGEDEFGELLRRHAEASGVDLSAVIPAPRTSRAVASIRADGAATYEFDIDWTLPAAPMVPRSRVVHVGSIGSWMDPGAEAVEKIVRQRPRGVKASFDPNVRPSLINDHAAGVARIERLIADADLVKLSDEDAEWLYPGRRPEDVLHRLCELGTGVAVMTLGARGAMAYAGAARVELPASSTLVADTIGAGDSFMAALLDAWFATDLRTGTDLGDADLTAMVRRALAASAVTVSRPGADPPWSRELVPN